MVYDHFHIRERECHEMSLVPDVVFTDMVSAEQGSNGMRGIFWGDLVLTGDYRLSVFEYLVVRDGRVEIEKYSYYLIHVEGYELWGYDKDPQHDPVVHGHMGRDHQRVPANEVTFKWVAEQAWETVTEEESLSDATSSAASVGDSQDGE
jgi:hypothetical protein